MILTKNRETGYARVNGANLHYNVVGEGFPLVLVHAGIADSRMWDKQVMAFAERFQVIAYDMRGFGKSEMPPGEFSHHRDLAELLRYLVVTKAHVLGISMGAAVAINFALEFPEYTQSLILAAPAVEGYRFKDARTREMWRAVDQALAHDRHELAADLELQMWVAGPGRSLDQVDPTILKLVREMLLPTYRIPPDLGTEQLLDPPAIERLPDIRIPTMVVVGDQDVPDILKVADLLVRAIPAAGKAVVPGVAQLLNMEKPNEFNKIVCDFLTTRRF
jgi:pimeloyl-ACP methyl ester carboxylesterase